FVSSSTARMGEQQLFDEVMTIFLAGYESTSTALTWLWYLLSENPEQYRALQDEIDTVLQGNHPSFENYRSLELCRMNFFESLRLYPPSPFVPREAVEADTLGEHQVDAGNFVFVFFYGVHRNPDVWNNPTVFDPLRFTPEREKERSRFAFVPFSAGLRQCVGNDFAIMEAVLIISMLLQRYHITVPQGQTVVPRVRATLHPANGLQIILQQH
ncbi:MAG: cytochrome P450, partial [Chloroflexota bacterium]